MKCNIRIHHWDNCGQLTASPVCRDMQHPGDVDRQIHRHAESAAASVLGSGSSAEEHILATQTTQVSAISHHLSQRHLLVTTILLEYTSSQCSDNSGGFTGGPSQLWPAPSGDGRMPSC